MALVFWLTFNVIGEVLSGILETGSRRWAGSSETADVAMTAQASIPFCIPLS